jgi:hypothetical protein
VSAAEDALKRVEELHERLVAARTELDKAAERDDPEAAVDILTQLSELAKEVEAELQKARARADAGG